MPVSNKFCQVFKLQKSESPITSPLRAAGWKQDLEKFRAEKQSEPVEAKVLNAVLSASSTPYR